MQVVLNKDVEKLGYRGDVVNVKPGYYRNFLMPQDLAVVATPAVLKISESRKEKMVIEKQQLIDNAKDALKKMKGMKVTIKAKTSDKGKLYAKITEAEVINAIEELYKIKLEKEFVKMDPIKELGEHDVVVHLAEDLEETIKVIVEAE